MCGIHQLEQGLVQYLCMIQQSLVGLGQRVIQQHPSAKGFELILGVYQQNVYEYHTKSIPQVVLVVRSRFSLGVLV